MALDETIAKHLEDYHLEACAVSSRELERAFDIRGPDLRRIINRLRGEGHPICSFDYGYYYAETEEELQRTIRQLRSRIKKIAHAERGLTKALTKRFPDSRQIALLLEGGDDFLKSFIPWVGGKGKLLWLIHRLSPLRYSRFIDVFGGSGTVTLSRPIQRGCMEVYNDFNSDLTNLFCCVKNRTMALLRELGFLPLNSRDDFNVLYKFFSKEEFTDDYLKEELELTEVYLEPPEAEAIKRLMLERAPRGDVRRAADYYKLIRYSFSGGAKSFGGKVCDIRRFFHLIWECSRRLAEVIVENKDCVDLIRQYDRGDAFFYCDPPYFEAEGCYAVEFPKEDHQRLHDALLKCEGHVMVSYNYCDYIVELYKEFYIFYTTRPNSMSQKAGSEYEEIVITNYDPRTLESVRNWQLSMFNLSIADEEDGRYTLIHEPETPNNNMEE